MGIKILLIHGPNLNLLGQRDASLYGLLTSEAILDHLQSNFDVDLNYFQSNSEFEIIDCIHAAPLQYNGIIINAGAFSHTSIGISDAIAAIKLPVINVHISNIEQREPFRQTDLLQGVCKGSIVGLGTDGYALALECLLDLVNA